MNEVLKAISGRRSLIGFGAILQSKDKTRRLLYGDYPSGKTRLLQSILPRNDEAKCL
jgi:hypothetical protein